MDTKAALQWTSEDGTTFTVGDLIYAHHSGIHRLTGITRRFYSQSYLPPSFKPLAKIGDEFSALLEYERILDGTFKPKKGKNQCDAGFCKVVTKASLEKEMDEKIQKLTLAYTDGLNFLFPRP